MKLRYLLALSISTSLFGAGAPSEKDKKTSELPFAGNAAAIQAAPAAPEAPACPTNLPVASKRVPNDPITQTQELECIWNGLWAEVEANVIAASQIPSREKPAYILPTIQQGEKHQPVEQTMKEFLPEIYEPTPEELLHAAMTPVLQAKIQAEMKWSDEVVTALLQKNPQRFNHYRDLQKKGVQWPHSSELRRYWERVDFVFRPMLIKRDRVVCDTCRAEVSGIMPWMNPLDYHDFTKNHAANDYQQLLERAKSFPAPKTDPARAALDANLRLITNYARSAHQNDAVAKLFLNTMSVKGQTPGWRKAAEYIQNPAGVTNPTR